MIFGKVDRHLQRNSKEIECESPVWQHICIFTIRQLLTNKPTKTLFISSHIIVSLMLGWLGVCC